MDGAIEDIRFLADSSHRPVALAMLADGPCSRMDLRAATGASSATIGRLAQAFEKRGWLTRDGSQYALTPLGEFVAERFADFHRDMIAVGELESVLSSIPHEQIGIDVDRLTDAKITSATPSNPFAVVSRVRELELDSAAAMSLTNFFPEPCIAARHEAIVEGTQRFDAIFTPGVLEAAMTSASADKFEAIVAADRTDIYRYDDSIEHPLMINDGIGCLIIRNEENVSTDLIESGDPAFVDWVTNVFETHRNEASLLTPDDLTPYRKYHRTET